MSLHRPMMRMWRSSPWIPMERPFYNGLWHCAALRGRPMCNLAPLFEEVSNDNEVAGKQRRMGMDTWSRRKREYRHTGGAESGFLEVFASRRIHACRTNRFGENGTKVVPFKLADIGEGIAEVEIMQWFVQPGDKVSQFDPLCEVQSDKATVEITSRFDGVIKSLGWNVGDMAKVGSTLVEIEVAKKDGANPASAPAPAQVDKKEAKAPKQEQPEKAPEQKQREEDAKHKGDDEEELPEMRAARLMANQGSLSLEPTLRPIPSERAQPRQAPPPLQRTTSFESSINKVLTTPSVRRLARDHQIDLTMVRATGKGGRILKEDVLEYINSGQAAQAKERKHEQRIRISQQVHEAEEETEFLPVLSRSPRTAAEDKVVQISGIQRQMVKSMTKALEIPHFNLMEEYNMNAVTQFRNDLRESAGHIRVSYLPIILKAVSLGLMEFPSINAHLSDDITTVTHKGSHNIGVAMDTPRGLLVPVVKDVQDLSILEIAHELNRLQQLGAANRFGEHDLSGGTIAISNIGSIGGTYASPVIMSPQVAIGALGRIQTVPRYHKGTGELYEAKIMNVSWAADHRVVDGATMARFSNKVKDYLENPTLFISSMR